MDTPDFIPDDQFKPDEPKAQAAPDFIPDEQFKPDDQTEKPQAAATPDFIPDDKFVPDDQKASTTEQQTENAFEGVARGVTFGLSDALASGMRKGATALGVSPEHLHYIAPDPNEMAQRQKANPIGSAASEIAGNLIVMKALPQMGSKLLDTAIKMGMISGGDEISKAMLGQGDPIPAVASHIAEAGAVGLLMGAAFGKTGSVLAKYSNQLAETKVGSRMLNFLSGIGHAASNPSLDSAATEKALQEASNSGLLGSKFNAKDFRDGQKIFNNTLMPAAKGSLKYGIAGTAATKASMIGYKLMGVPGASIGGVLGERIGEKIGSIVSDKVIPKVSQKVIGPMLTKMAASGTMDGVADAIDHGITTSKGARAIGNGVSSLFTAGASELGNELSKEQVQKQKEKLRHLIENNALGEQLREHAKSQVPQYAEGGQILPMPELNNQSPIARIWPEQNMLLNAAKSRVSNYLNSVRPMPKTGKLPFDTDHKDPQKERDYNGALDLAIQPLSILKHIKKGTLLPKHVAAINAMYPELHEHLSKKMMEELVKHQADETQKPPYHIRQALSLFMGTNLDSTLTPANMQAAQNVFMQQKTQRQQATKSTAGLSKMGKNAQTADQSRTQRLNKS